MSVLGSVTDPDGRLVELTQERWEHIIEPGMAIRSWSLTRTPYSKLFAPRIARGPVAGLTRNGSIAEPWGQANG